MQKLAEVVRQVRWRLLRNQEQDPHGVQVCVGGLPHCHLQQRGQTLVSMPALHRTRPVWGHASMPGAALTEALMSKLLACICSHQDAREVARIRAGMLCCHAPLEGDNQ